jgi:hypothetical protein
MGIKPVTFRFVACYCYCVPLEKKVLRRIFGPKRDEVTGT